eukprot:gene13306-17674_t
MALFAVMVGFASANQDIVIDAWRIEAADKDRQGPMAAAYQWGYRISMVLAEILDEVVGEGVVVVDHQDHGVRPRGLAVSGRRRVHRSGSRLRSEPKRISPKPTTQAGSDSASRMPAKTRSSAIRFGDIVAQQRDRLAGKRLT